MAEKIENHCFLNFLLYFSTKKSKTHKTFTNFDTHVQNAYLGYIFHFLNIGGKSWPKKVRKL